MAADVGFSSTSGAGALQGQLFDDMKFWLSAKVPQRSRFITDIKANGGEVVQLEKNADIKVVDHARKEAPVGTHSYTFVEKSIRNGALEDLADHAVGPAPGTVRSVGSITQPPKLSRQKYTQEDERILWDWVNANPQRGGGTDGNEIYKQLEAKHPQHPWQSWRDHYIKFMKGKARPIYPPNNAPPTPPSEFPTTHSGPAQQDILQDEAIEDAFDRFSESDEDALMEQGQYILDVSAEDLPAAWARWADEKDIDKKHTAEQWQAFWEQRVRPKFLRIEARRNKKAAATEKSSPGPPISGNPPVTHAPPLTITSDNARLLRRTPSYNKETPKLRAMTPSFPPLVVQDSIPAVVPEPTEDVVSPLGNSILKRKRPIAEEIPSSSPPQIKLTPLPNRSAKKPREIASTPDRSPRRHIKEKHETLFLEDVFEAETDEILKDSQESSSSPLGQQPSESLSEPDRTTRHSTQALFRAATPHIDFEVPSPEGGWGGDEDADNADKSESESQYNSTREMPALPNTQAVLESKTQVADLTIPDPDDPWDTLLPPSSPPTIMPSSPAAASESSSAQQAHVDAMIDAFITERVAQGFSAEQVVAVLNSTCTDIPLTDEVLQQMGPQKGRVELPENMKGVWTEDDDRDLYSSDARKVGRLEPKHGADQVNARYEWLQLMAEDE